MPTSSDKNIATPIFNVLTRDIYISLTTSGSIDPDQFYLITDDTPVEAGTGLTASTAGGSTVLNHSNTVSAKTIQALYPITFDSEGHITGAGAAIDVSDIGGGSGPGDAYVPVSAVVGASVVVSAVYTATTENLTFTTSTISVINS